MASRKAGISAKMEHAALELYAERKTLKITAAEIAVRAGTTERTFFRHFPDKLDAFFGDESRLRARVEEVIDACPRQASALDTALAGLSALAADFELHSEAIRARAAVVAAHPELQAREIARTAPWIALIRRALQRRDCPAREVDVAVPLALMVFRVAYEQWSTEPEGRSFPDRLDDVLDEIHSQIGRGRADLDRPGT